MFQSARIKLTAFYLLIIMTISISFSVLVYRSLCFEIARGMRFQALHIITKNNAPNSEEEVQERFILGFPFLPVDPGNLPPNFHQQIFEEAKKRVAVELGFINLVILVISGGSGYLLAGLTLKPIAEMIDEQKKFVADASHELRTPLAALKSEIEVALRDKKLDLKTAKQLLDSNLEETNKLKSLTDYFLTLSKYDTPHSQLTFEKFNLSEAINEAEKRIGNAAREKKIDIVNNLKNIQIEANKTSLVELATILLDNAVKFSHEGNKITISTEIKKNLALIRVEDFGIGIKLTDLPHIFDRFFRTDHSRTHLRGGRLSLRSHDSSDGEIIGGFGLGLAIAKSIVDLHHGKIAVESIINNGSVFTVSLPLKQGHNLSKI